MQVETVSLLTTAQGLTPDMPLHHAALALLASKPAHGYEVTSSFELAVGGPLEVIHRGSLSGATWMSGRVQRC